MRKDEYERIIEWAIDYYCCLLCLMLKAYNQFTQNIRMYSSFTFLLRHR